MDIAASYVRGLAAHCLPPAPPVVHHVGVMQRADRKWFVYRGDIPA
jgi:hypothetical protein